MLNKIYVATLCTLFLNYGTAVLASGMPPAEEMNKTFSSKITSFLYQDVKSTDELEGMLDAFLDQEGCDPNLIITDASCTYWHLRLIHVVTMHGNAASMRKLLAKGASPAYACQKANFHSDFQPYGPFALALNRIALKKKPEQNATASEIATCLIEHQRALKESCTDSTTPTLSDLIGLEQNMFKATVENGNLAIAQMLHAHGCNIKAATSNGTSLLFTLAAKPDITAASAIDFLSWYYSLPAADRFDINHENNKGLRLLDRICELCPSDDKRAAIVDCLEGLGATHSATYLAAIES